jgi:hypothetical protein
MSNGSMSAAPLTAIPPVHAEVKLDGSSIPCCIRPELDERQLVLGNFRPEEESLIYARRGPYLTIYIKDVDFVSLLGRRTVTLPAPFTGNPRWFGYMWMVGGRAACDFPDEKRSFEQLTVSTSRSAASTTIAFQAKFGPRQDPGAWPRTMLLDMWFDVPDAEIDRFVVRPEARRIFKGLIARW